MSKENKKPNKSAQVKTHLIKHGSITSWEAIQKYKATRLSAIIFNLRHKQKMAIKSIDTRGIDCNGNDSRWANYVYTAPEK